MDALQAHLSRAALRKAEMIRSGELPQSAKGGKPRKPTACPRCGLEQPSARIAWMHCRASRTPATSDHATSDHSDSG